MGRHGFHHSTTHTWPFLLLVGGTHQHCTSRNNYSYSLATDTKLNPNYQCSTSRWPYHLRMDAIQCPSCWSWTHYNIQRSKVCQHKTIPQRWQCVTYHSTYTWHYSFLSLPDFLLCPSPLCLLQWRDRKRQPLHSSSSPPLSVPDLSYSSNTSSSHTFSGFSRHISQSVVATTSLTSPPNTLQHQTSPTTPSPSAQHNAAIAK